MVGRLNASEPNGNEYGERETKGAELCFPDGSMLIVGRAVKESVICRILWEGAEGACLRGSETTVVHVVVVVGLTKEEPDYGGLGLALGGGDVLEDGWFDQGVLLEGEEALRMFVMEIGPPRRNYPRAGSSFDEVFDHL